MLYFAYGSNLNHHQMNYRCSGAKYIKKHILNGYKLCFSHKTNHSIYGHANIIKSKKSKVPGALWKISKKDEKELLDKKNGCLIVNTYIELLPNKNKSFEKIIHDTTVMWISLIEKLLQTAKKNNELTHNTNILDATHIIYTLIIGTCVLSKTKTNNKQLLNSLKIIKNTIFQ